ncbi:RNA-directed DNA polymerase, eukaryota, reverse transcriptase zinc-binding domain protein [Tanacetum coccineum]
MNNGNKQKEVLKFIREERLQVCAVIETHLKAKKIKDVCDKLFGSWEWISNTQYSMNSCRIVLCWNPASVRMHVIQISRQAILCQIESIDGNVKFYCTFVYASNNKEERKILWKELYMHKRVSNNHPWALLGDLNVTLNVDEHSSGGSFINEEMQEFKDCINLIEIEDIRSTGFFYTWTKSLKNPDNSVLKKLDRVMVSESFHEDFARSQAIFLPFMISDHSPATLVIPSCGIKKANLVKKIKALKPILNKMNWKNGDLTVKVGNLRELLKESQATVEKNPHDQNLRKKSIEIIEEYLHSFTKSSRAEEEEIGSIQFEMKMDEANIMIREVIDDEIKNALFDIRDNKASGRDGYSYVFFKKAWNIIRKDVCEAIKEFFLSGRLMLIAVVLEAISVYWAPMFKIPKTVIKEINGILKRYLWSNSESARGKPKVAWKQVSSKKDSLWVKWIHVVRLKDASIWSVQWNEKDGWNWKCLLKIRDKIAHNFQFKIRDGSNILMWYDRWHDDGLLINKVTNRDLYNARIPKMIGINSMMVNGEWNWRDEWNRNEFEVMNIRPPMIILGKKDIVKWRHGNKFLPFHPRLVLEYLSTNNNRVDWKIEFVWEVIVQTLIGMKNGNNIWSVVRRLSLAAVVYNIWQERNHRIFRGEKSDSSALIIKINETIRLKLMNINVKDSNAVRIVTET